METTAPAPIRVRKLTESQALEILHCTDPQRVIAKRFGIQQPMVCDIKSGRRWGHLQPEKAYTPKPKPLKNPDLVTDDQIRKYDPMIKKMINEHVLRYWAGGNTCNTLDSRATIGRLGKSVEDLIQDGRLIVFQQLQWIQRNRKRGAGMAKEATLVYFQLKRKFISLSRGFSTARHGGQVVAMTENRNTIQGLMDSIPSDMPLDDAIARVQSATVSLNKDLRKALLARLVDVKGTVKVGSTEQLVETLRLRLVDMATTTVVSLDSMENPGDFAMEPTNGSGEHHRSVAIDFTNPETYALVAEQLRMMAATGDFDPETQTVSAGRHFGGRATFKFRIFQLAKAKGLPFTHCALAAHLGRSPSAMSNILYNNSDGTPEFRQKLLDVFGEPLDELRRAVA